MGKGHPGAEDPLMKIQLKAIALTAALVIPGALVAQDRDHQRPNDQQQVRRYQDRAHNDSHEWNDTEDQRYRQYLQEHHKKYHNFSSARKSEQNNYWNWVHSHDGNDRH